MKKRLARRAAALLLSLLLCLLTACGGSTDSTDDASTGDTAAGGNNHVPVLRIGTTFANDTFSVYSSGGAFGRLNYYSFTNLGFWTFDENNEISTEGCFFRTWEVSEDNTTLRLTYDLTGLTWHDGNPVTDEDVAFTFDFWKAQNYPLFLHIAEVTLPEDGVCEVTFDSPMAFSFMNQTTMMYPIMPSHIWADVENPAEYDGDDKSVGCGPFRLVSVDEDAQVSYYEAVENYPLGEVTVDRVEVHSFDNNASMVQALLQDRIDAVYGYSSGVDTTLIPMLENAPDIDLGQSLNTATYQMMFGFNQYPTNDLPLRQAVACALDYELLAQVLGGSYGQVASTGAVSPVCLGFDGSLPLNTRDLEKAGKILDEAGYADVDGDGFRELPDGGQMTLRIGLQSTTDLYKRNAEILQTNLAEAGIRAQVDEQTISNADYRTAQRMEGLYDLWLSQTTVGMAVWGGVAHYAAAVTITSGQRFGTYADPAYLAAYEAMSSAPDYEAYTAAFTDLQQMNAEAVPVIAFGVSSIFFPYRTDKITGWTNYDARGVINTATWYNACAK